MLITPTLNQLVPDPAQPRRVLPEDLRERLLSPDPRTEGGASAVDLFWRMWRRCLGGKLYRTMRAYDISPREALTQRREEGVLNLALQLKLEGLVELVESIRHRYSRRPISAYDPNGGKYRITEGVWQWWAYIHLRHLLLQRDFSTILVQVRSLPDDASGALTRQYAESMRRRDLPAVARARVIRQVQRLIREAPGPTQKVLGPTGSRDSGGCPRDVRPLTKHQLDARTGKRLERLAGRGISGRMVRRYLALLTLPPEAQALAEAADLSERALRSIVSLDDPAEQTRLARALAAGEMTPTQVKREVRSP